jgi:hypothetical protein
MEWHLVRSIAAAFFLILGFLIDLQSILGAISFLRRNRGSKPVLGWSLICYAAGAFCLDIRLGEQVIVFLAGVVLEAMALLLLIVGKSK